MRMACLDLLITERPMAAVISTSPAFPVLPTIRGTLGHLRTHLKAHYGRLGRTSRRLRFLSEASEVALDRVAAGAIPDLMIEIERDGAVRGVFEAYDTGDGHAEIALSIEDAYQGLGLGRTLLQEGLRQLARRDYAIAELFCLRENMPMLHLVREAGGRITFDGGEARAEIDLGRVPD